MSDNPLKPGDLIELDGEPWCVTPSILTTTPRTNAVPLRHPYELRERVVSLPHAKAYRFGNIDEVLSAAKREASK